MALDRVARKLGCTREGMTWMKNALDPFPDVKRDMVGFPDTVKTPSILQYFREEINITTPSIGGVNWDCNIYHPGYYGGGTQYTTNVVTANGSAVGINTAGQVLSVPTGSIMARAGISGNALPESTVVASLPDSVSLALPNRIVAFGFEVFNSTPEFYRGGTVTTWRQPPLLQEGSILTITNAGATPSANTFNVYNDPPNTSALALNLEGSLEWDAEEGAYCVGVMSEPLNQPKTLISENANLMLSAGIYYGEQFALASTFVLSPNVNKIRSPWDQFGAYFTGLDTHTSLKVVKHYLIERFPTYTVPDLVTLARPTPPYDPRALELYTQIASFLPTGVPVEDNFIGAFLQGLATVARAVAPVIIPAIANAITGSLAKKEEKPKKQSQEIVVYQPQQQSTAQHVANALVPLAETAVRMLTPVRASPEQPAQVPNKGRTMQSNVFVSSSSNRRAASGKGKQQRGKRLLDRAFETAA